MASWVVLKVLGCLLSMVLVFVVLVGTHRLVVKLDQDRNRDRSDDVATSVPTVAVRP